MKGDNNKKAGKLDKKNFHISLLASLFTVLIIISIEGVTFILTRPDNWIIGLVSKAITSFILAMIILYFINRYTELL